MASGKKRQYEMLNNFDILYLIVMDATGIRIEFQTSLAYYIGIDLLNSMATFWHF